MPTRPALAHRTRAVHKSSCKEVKPIVGLVSVIILKHPAVLDHGEGPFPRCVLARVLSLLPLTLRRVLRHARTHAHAPDTHTAACWPFCDARSLTTLPVCSTQLGGGGRAAGGDARPGHAHRQLTARGLLRAVLWRGGAVRRSVPRRAMKAHSPAMVSSDSSPLRVRPGRAAGAPGERRFPGGLRAHAAGSCVSAALPRVVLRPGASDSRAAAAHRRCSPRRRRGAVGA